MPSRIGSAARERGRKILERETGLELATSTLARLCFRSSNPLIYIRIMHYDGSLISAQYAHQALNEASGGEIRPSQTIYPPTEPPRKIPLYAVPKTVGMTA
jgi:hypothetical protein